MINPQITENMEYNSKNSQKTNANFVMGYALNLCKFRLYKVPYNHNIIEEGMEMTQNRIRIVDVADALGLSTATVSKVIHGKTEKERTFGFQRISRSSALMIPWQAGKAILPSQRFIRKLA